jgi:cytochrome bd-type quinol oxidase subunit 2
MSYNALYTSKTSYTFVYISSVCIHYIYVLYIVIITIYNETENETQQETRHQEEQRKVKCVLCVGYCCVWSMEGIVDNPIPKVCKQ